jgi:hypothetical protein
VREKVWECLSLPVDAHCSVSISLPLVGVPVGGDTIMSAERSARVDGLVHSRRGEGADAGGVIEGVNGASEVRVVKATSFVAMSLLSLRSATAEMKRSIGVRVAVSDGCIGWSLEPVDDVLVSQYGEQIVTIFEDLFLRFISRDLVESEASGSEEPVTEAMVL